LNARLVRGGYPEAVFSATERAREAWFSSYLLAMVQRDIRDISNVSDVAAMGRLLRVLAARTARIVNFTSLASESGIPKTTLIRYVDLLEQAYLIHRIPAWSRDLGRRLTKLPKLFIGDVGIAAHEMHAGLERLSLDRNLLGGLLETFVLNELRKHLAWSAQRVSIAHYREQGGSEIDFVLESASGARALVEVKASSSPTADDARAMLRLMDDPAFNAVRGILVHTGSSIIPIRRNVHAVPMSVFWTPSAADDRARALAE
jgi:predicted AAA+ superfamily ATPase